VEGGNPVEGVVPADGVKIPRGGWKGHQMMQCCWKKTGACSSICRCKRRGWGGYVICIAESQCPSVPKFRLMECLSDDVPQTSPRIPESQIFNKPDSGHPRETTHTHTYTYILPCCPMEALDSLHMARGLAG
jgi:hypothetical protein